MAFLKALEARQANGIHWVDTWTSMPQLVKTANLPPSPFVSFLCPNAFNWLRCNFQTASSAVFSDATVRQALHMSIGAERIRIQISNTFGGSNLTITTASVGLPTGGKAGVSGIEASPLKGLTFNGADSVTIPKGEVAYTDPVGFIIKPMSMITVTM
jgi:ABC-type oligopeptide transport system substrate-binding subunit